MPDQQIYGDRYFDPDDPKNQLPPKKKTKGEQLEEKGDYIDTGELDDQGQPEMFTQTKQLFGTDLANDIEEAVSGFGASAYQKLIEQSQRQDLIGGTLRFGGDVISGSIENIEASKDPFNLQDEYGSSNPLINLMQIVAGYSLRGTGKALELAGAPARFVGEKAGDVAEFAGVDPRLVELPVEIGSDILIGAAAPKLLKKGVKLSAPLLEKLVKSGNERLRGLGSIVEGGPGAAIVGNVGTGGAKSASGGGRPARRRSLYGETFEKAKTYKSELQLQQVEEELVLNWGMKDRVFNFKQYQAGSGNKRKLGALFQSVPYTKVNYDIRAKELMPELRKYYAPILEDIGLNPGDFQLHHQQPILASLPGYDGLRFGSDEWWDVTEILWKNGLRAGDADKNLIPLVGGSKASRKNVKNKKVLDIRGKFETPHSVTHKYLDEKVGPDGTLFWTEDVLDRINGRGKWAGKGTDHQFRKDKWQEYSEIVVKSKQITDQAEQTFKDLYKRNPALKNVPMDDQELDLIIERLIKLEEDGLLKPEILEGKWQVNQMESIVMDVTEELQKSQADINYRTVFGRDGLLQKFVDQQEITVKELRELDKLPLSEQLEYLQKYTGMTIADIDLLIQTQPNFDPIKFIKDNR